MLEMFSIGAKTSVDVWYVLIAVFLLSFALSFKIYRKTPIQNSWVKFIPSIIVFGSIYSSLVGLMGSLIFYSCLPDGMCLLLIFALAPVGVFSLAIGVVFYAIIFLFVHDLKSSVAYKIIENIIITISIIALAYFAFMMISIHQKNVRQIESSHTSNVSRQTQSSLFDKLSVPENKPPLVGSTSTQSTSTATAISNNELLKLLSPNGGEEIKIGTSFKINWQETKVPKGALIDAELFKIEGNKIIFGKNGECTNCVGGGLRSGVSARTSVSNGVGSAVWTAGFTFSRDSTVDVGSNYVMTITASRAGKAGECPGQLSCTIDIATDWSDSVFRLW